MTEQDRPHNLTLETRSKLTLTGVTDVVSFDEGIVIMHTPLGDLTVQGEHLQLKSLAPEGGNVTVQGTIDSLSYEQPRTGSRLSRFFG